MEEQKELQSFEEMMKDFVGTKQWSVIESLLREQIANITDIRQTKDIIDPVAFTVEMKARKLAAEALEKFLEQVGIFKPDSKQPTDGMLMRNFR